MVHLSEEQLRMILSATRARRKHRSVPEENRSARAQILSKRRIYAERVLLPILADKGHDLHELQKICEQHQSDIRYFLETTALGKRSSRARDTSRGTDALHPSIETRRKMIEEFRFRDKSTISSSVNYNFVVLDTPI